MVLNGFLHTISFPDCKMQDNTRVRRHQPSPTSGHLSSFVAFTKLLRKALLQLTVESVLGLFAVRMLFSFFRFFAFYVPARSVIFDKDTPKYRSSI